MPEIAPTRALRLDVASRAPVTCRSIPVPRGVRDVGHPHRSCYMRIGARRASCTNSVRVGFAVARAAARRRRSESSRPTRRSAASRPSRSGWCCSRSRALAALALATYTRAIRSSVARRRERAGILGATLAGLLLPHGRLRRRRSRRRGGRVGGRLLLGRGLPRARGSGRSAALLLLAVRDAPAARCTRRRPCARRRRQRSARRAGSPRASAASQPLGRAALNVLLR